MAPHDSLAAQRGSVFVPVRRLPPAATTNGTWRLAACSGNVLFLSAVAALQPRVQWQGRTGEELLHNLACQPHRSLLLIATDDLLDLSLQELLPLLQAQLPPAQVRVVLFLEDQVDTERLRGLMGAGAQVICRLQRFQGALLASAINSALLHRPWLDPLYAALLRQDGAAGGGGPHQPWDLPRRERELLRQVGQGYNALEISHRLGIRCDTVRRSLSRLYRRIGVRDRAQAVGWCLCHGLISRQELNHRYRLAVRPEGPP